MTRTRLLEVLGYGLWVEAMVRVSASLPSRPAARGFMAVIVPYKSVLSTGPACNRAGVGGRGSRWFTVTATVRETMSVTLESMSVTLESMKGTRSRNLSKCTLIL